MAKEFSRRGFLGYLGVGTVAVRQVTGAVRGITTWALGNSLRYARRLISGEQTYRIETELGVILIDTLDGIDEGDLDGTVSLNDCRLEVPAAVLLQLLPGQKPSAVNKRLNVGAQERFVLELVGQANLTNSVLVLKKQLELRFSASAVFRRQSKEAPLKLDFEDRKISILLKVSSLGIALPSAISS